MVFKFKEFSAPLPLPNVLDWPATNKAHWKTDVTTWRFKNMGLVFPVTTDSSTAPPMNFDSLKTVHISRSTLSPILFANVSGRDRPTALVLDWLDQFSRDYIIVEVTWLLPPSQIVTTLHRQPSFQRESSQRPNPSRWKHLCIIGSFKIKC